MGKGRRMRILLIQPPMRTTDLFVARLYPIPLGLVSIGTILRERGHTVDLKDFLAPAQKRPIKTPASFKGKHPPLLYHYGASHSESVQWLRRHLDNYDAVGVYVAIGNHRTGAPIVAHEADRQGKAVVIGGPFASTAPHSALKTIPANVIVQGEGEDVCEEAFRVALKRRCSNKPVQHIKGIPVSLPDLPLPDWTLAPLQNYPEWNGKVRGVLTISRGCPWRCTFCSVHTITGRKHRRQTSMRIYDELENLYSAGARAFCFLDDNLFVSDKATEEVLEAIAGLKARHRELRSPRFYVEEGIEVRMAARPGLVRDIQNAGFEELALGLESMRASNRRSMKKPYTPKQLERAIAECQSAPKPVRAFFIIGFPEDTLESLAEDIVRFGKTGLGVRANNLKLYPNTQMTEEYQRRGWLDDGYDWRLSTFYTPGRTDLPFKTIRKLKSMVAAVGGVAEMYGVRLFADGWKGMRDSFARKGIKLQYLKDGGIKITGNMYRRSFYQHIATLLTLRFCSAGGASRGDTTHDSVESHPIDTAQDDIQRAFKRALHQEEGQSG